MDNGQFLDLLSEEWGGGGFNDTKKGVFFIYFCSMNVKRDSPSYPYCKGAAMRQH